MIKSKNNKHLFISILFYLICWFIAAKYFIHGINPDSISYISISKKYYNGNFFEAINAYWGPLFSWLLLPSFLLKIEQHIFARLITIFLSIILFVLINKFLIRLNVNEKIRVLGIYFFILPAIYFSFYRLTPDYLLLIITLIYVYLTTEEKFWDSKSLVFLSSFLGALMFLTKSYGLMFFLSYQTILIFIEYLLYKKISKIVLVRYIVSIILFLILIAPWIYLLSEKYGSFTISSSGTINLRIVNPELNFKHPSIDSGFAIPSDKFSVSAWDDPNINSYPNWNPFSNIQDLKYFVFNTLKNVLKFLLFFIVFSPPLALFAFLIKVKDLKNIILLKILIAAIIFALGYTPIYIENRYIWPTFILLSLIGFYSLSSAQIKIFTSKTYSVLINLIIIISFSPFMIYGLKQQAPNNDFYFQAKNIKDRFELFGNFASTNHWEQGLAFSYFLNSKFFGTEKLSINNPKLYEKAKKLGINYIFDYTEEPYQLSNLKFIGKIDSIRIFKVE
ncbi:MAG: hypothetical protein NZM09_01810 [Ignavibacterium sp.]|nr:hypothetical protein [Ignavibacterium sp.]MDW8374410.1 hypothetical protein [Ignavibacteriales bacterium]